MAQSTNTTKAANLNAGLFSFYPDNTSKTTGKRVAGVFQQIGTTTNCCELAKYITGETTYPLLEQRTFQIRQIYNLPLSLKERKDKAKPIKNTLPLFRAIGIFQHVPESERTADQAAQQMQGSSNLICLDFDHITDIQAAWQRLIDDATIQPILMFHSPSGLGIKCIIPFPEYKSKKKWEYYYKAIAEHYGDITSTDTKTGEIIQALDRNNAISSLNNNSICFDKSAYYNAAMDPESPRHTPEPFAAAIAYIVNRAAEIEAAEPKPQPTAIHSPARPFTAPSNGRTFTAGEMADYTLKVVSWYADNLKTDITKGNATTAGWLQWRKVAFALTDGTIPEEQARALFHKVSALYPEYDREECDKAFTRAKKNRNGKLNMGSFIRWAAEAIGQTYEQAHGYTKKEQPLATMATLSTLATIATPAEMATLSTMANEEPADTDKAAAPIQEPIAAQQQMETPTTPQTTFRQTTLADIQAEAAKAAPSIPTAFSFGGTPLTLRSSALTLIAAKSSHGKTRLLENMAYYTATHDTDQPEAATILFTLEEPAKNIFAHLTGIHALTNGKQCNIKDLDNALCGKADPANANGLNEALQDLDKTLQRHHLYLFGDTDTPANPNPYGNGRWDYTTVQAICEDMRTFARQKPIKAIYIDHLQMLQYQGEGTRTAKTERIELILTELERLAKELHIPVVITAQMTRNTHNGTNMTGSNIAESADTERSADTILLLWNSSFPFANAQGEPTGTDREETQKHSCNDEAKTLANIGYHFTDEDEEQLMLAVLYKRRGGKRGGRATFAYHAASGLIEPLHATEDERQQHTVSSTCTKRQKITTAELSRMSEAEKQEKLQKLFDQHKKL